MKRSDAAELGLRKYTPDNPCPKCATLLRYTSTGTCVQCTTTRNAHINAVMNQNASANLESGRKQLSLSTNQNGRDFLIRMNGILQEMGYPKASQEFLREWAIQTRALIRAGMCDGSVEMPVAREVKPPHLARVAAESDDTARRNAGNTGRADA